MSEYEQKYYELVKFRQNVQPLQHKAGITETHHIKLASLWPHLKDDLSNKVELTVLEHIQAHKLLAYWYEEKYGISDNRYLAAFEAYHLMCTTRTGVQLTDEEAAKLRSDYARNCSLRRKGKPLSQKNKASITLAWQNAKLKEEQSRRIRSAYAVTAVRQKISDANKRRYSNPLEREKTKQRSLNYFQTHPEAKLKHSNDLKGRIYIYNIASRKQKMVRKEDVQEWLDKGWTRGTLLYRAVKRGKNKGTLQTMYVCPWKIDTCCWLRPNSRGQAPTWSLEKPEISS